MGMRKELCVFPVPVGLEVDPHPFRGPTLVILCSSHNWLLLPIASTLPNDGFVTVEISPSGRGTSGSSLGAPSELSALYLRAHYHSGTVFPGLWPEDHPGRFGKGKHFRSAYFRFRRSSPGHQRGTPSRRRYLLARGRLTTWIFHVGKSAHFNTEIYEITLGDVNYA